MIAKKLFHYIKDLSEAEVIFFYENYTVSNVSKKIARIELFSWIRTREAFNILEFKNKFKAKDILRSCKRLMLLIEAYMLAYHYDNNYNDLDQFYRAETLKQKDYVYLALEHLKQLEQKTKEAKNYTLYIKAIRQQSIIYLKSHNKKKLEENRNKEINFSSKSKLKEINCYYDLLVLKIKFTGYLLDIESIDSKKISTPKEIALLDADVSNYNYKIKEKQLIVKALYYFLKRDLKNCLKYNEALIAFYEENFKTEKFSFIGYISTLINMIKFIDNSVEAYRYLLKLRDLEVSAEKMNSPYKKGKYYFHFSNCKTNLLIKNKAYSKVLAYENEYRMVSEKYSKHVSFYHMYSVWYNLGFAHFQTKNYHEALYYYKTLKDDSNVKKRRKFQIYGLLNHLFCLIETESSQTFLESNLKSIEYQLKERNNTIKQVLLLSRSLIKGKTKNRNSIKQKHLPLFLEIIKSHPEEKDLIEGLGLLSWLNNSEQLIRAKI